MRDENKKRSSMLGSLFSYYECLKFATLMKIAIPFNGFS